MTPDTPRVAILLSTYQGERFVREQLLSILSQLPADGRVFVRDDGSSDRTPEEVAAIGDPRIQLVRGQNVGFGRSFLTLLASVPDDFDMVMFADQDDVWLPYKVDRAWEHLRDHRDEPALYGSAQLLVDDRLQPLHPTEPWPRGPSLANALVENIITGCTAALNGPAVRLLQQAGVPPGVHFHDWWLYLVVSAFGTVVYDDQPSLLYRQHGGNVIGHGAGWWGRRRRIVSFIARYDWVGILRRQVQAFLQFYGGLLQASTRSLILRHFDDARQGAMPRWRLVLSLRRWRQAPADEFALRLMLAAYKLRLWPPAGRRL